MLRKLTLLALVLGLAMLARSAVAEEAPPLPSRWIPDDAVIALEVNQAKPVLDLLLDEKTLNAVISLPAYPKVTEQPNVRQLFFGVTILEASLGTDWKTGLRKLFRSGSVSVHPGGGALLIVEADDAALLNRLQDVLLALVKADAENKGQPGRVMSAEYKGVKAWRFGGQAMHAIVGNRLLLANRQELLQAALDLREKPGKCLADTPAYQAARQQAGPNAAGVAVANMEVLKQLPGVQKLLEPNENPMATLLFAGVTESLRGSTWLGFALGVEGDKLVLKAAADGKSPDAAGTASFALPTPDQGAFPQLNVPRRIAAFSFYRNLHDFYAAKDTLFPDRTSGLIFFENMMGIFFTGRDLTDEVLAEAEPQIRVVVAGQKYDPAIGTPRLQIPAFGVVFRLKHPQQFHEVAEEAWQKALGLVNFTRGQQALPGMILDRPMHGDLQFTVAYFAAPKEGEKTDVDSRYNLRPALAMPGDYMILSSTEVLARDLIDAVKQEAEAKTQPRFAAHSLVDVDGGLLTALIKANRENMVGQNMVEKGNTREQAEGEIDMLISLVGLLGGAKLEVASPQGGSRATLEVTLHRQ